MFENLERLTVVTIQPLLGGEPHEPFAVLDDVKNRILRQSFIGGQMVELQGFGVSSCISGEPQDKKSKKVFHRIVFEPFLSKYTTLFMIMDDIISYFLDD